MANGVNKAKWLPSATMGANTWLMEIGTDADADDAISVASHVCGSEGRVPLPSAMTVPDT